jgi:phosphatidylinositol glycan class O
MTLGIPIPFSSLGMIIPEVFLPYQGSDSDSKNDDESLDDGFSGRVTMDLLVALQENALQIQKYLTTYAKHSDDFPSDTFQSLQGDLNRALELHKKLVEREDIKLSQKELTDTAAAYIGYMKAVKVMCQSIWAKFDDISITEGLILLLLSVILVPLMLVDVESSTSTLRKALPYGAISGLGVTVVLALFSNFVQLELTFSGVISLVLTLSLHSLAASIVIFILFFSPAIFESLKDLFCRQRLLSFVNQLSVLQLLSIAITILYGVAMLSNSFVLYEADMVSFFLQSLLVCFAVRNLQIEFSSETNLVLDRATLNRVAKTVAPHVGAMVCVRLVKIFYACRDLQVQDGCLATTFIHALPVAYEFLGEWLAYSRMALSCTAVVSVPVGFLLLVQRNTGARYLNQWLLYVARYGYLLAVLCVCGFWMLLCLPQTDLEDLSWWKHVTLPRVVYLVSAVAVVLCIAIPFKRGEKVLTMNCEENPNNNNITSVTSTLNDGAKNRNESNFLCESETQGPRLRRLNLHHIQPDDRFSQDMVSHVLHPSLTELIPLTDLFLLVALWIPVALLLNDSIALSAVIMAAQVALTIKGLKDKEPGIVWYLAPKFASIPQIVVFVS